MREKKDNKSEIKKGHDKSLSTGHPPSNHEMQDRIKTEEKLRISEERLRLAIYGGQLGTWDRDLVTGDIEWNPYLYELLGRDPEGPAITGETFFEYIHPDDVGRVRRRVENVLKSGDDFRGEFRIIRENGEDRWLGASGRIYRDEKGKPIRMAGVNFDITDRKNMERKLRRSHEELEQKVEQRTSELTRVNRMLEAEVERRRRFEEALKGASNKILAESKRREFLSRRLVETLERDRRDVAMYLHDEIGQMLATLKMDLEMTRAACGEMNASQGEKLGQMEKKVADLMGHIKDISRKLRPDMLDTLGLIPAVRSMVGDFQEETGLRVHFFQKGVPERISPERALSIYRIVQEALNNVYKHARASEVFVNMGTKERFLRVSIEDNGMGFRYDEVKKGVSDKGPLGLMIMKERAFLAGGELRVESEIGKGTHVVVEIPVY